jgi:CO dehydrogenase/acetyl-CoA synthase alpha subunit
MTVTVTEPFCCKFCALGSSKRFVKFQDCDGGSATLAHVRHSVEKNIRRIGLLQGNRGMSREVNNMYEV